MRRRLAPDPCLCQSISRLGYFLPDSWNLKLGMMLIHKLKNKRKWKMPGIIALALMLRLIFFHGFFPSDQYSYAAEAVDVIRGEWRVPDIEASTRWGIIVPTAMFYWLFGITEYSSALWPMLCSLGTVVVAYFLGKHFKDDQAGCLAALLVAVFPLEITYAGQLMADSPMSFWLLFALCCLLRGDGGESPGFKKHYLLMSGIALGMAYATKTGAIFAFPFVAIYAFLRPRKIVPRLGWLALGLGIVLVIEFFFFLAIANDGFLRFTLSWAARGARAQDLLAGALSTSTSFTEYLVWLLVDVHYVGLSFVVLLIVLTFQIEGGLPDRCTQKYSYWPLLLWSGMLIGILTFYPLSMKPYVPLYKQANYMLMFTAPLLVVLALVLRQLPKSVRQTANCLIVLSCFPVAYLSREGHRAHVDNSRVVHDFYRAHPDRPLYASTYNVASLEFFAGFKNVENYRNFTVATPWNQRAAQHSSVCFDSSYVVVDRYFIDYYGRKGHRFPAEVLNPPPNWKPVFIYQRKENGLRSATLQLAGVLLQNGFITARIYQRLAQKVRQWSHNQPVIIYATS